MNRVVDIRAFMTARTEPTLVLIDFQQEYLAGTRVLAPADRESALKNCRDALNHARGMHFQIAFVRWTGRDRNLQATSRHLGWIESLEPRGSDMVFDRDQPSCFAGSLFADVMSESARRIVLAGLAGEACISTAIDAFHRGHEFTYLADASASISTGSVSGSDVHATVQKVIAFYGAVTSTGVWIKNTSQRRSAANQ